MIKLENITSEPFQRHEIISDGGNVVIILKFHDVIGIWTIDVERNGTEVKGVKLSSGVKHIQSSLLGVDFIVFSQGDIDPYKIDDFSSERCTLLMVDYDTI